MGLSVRKVFASETTPTHIFVHHCVFPGGGVIGDGKEQGNAPGRQRSSENLSTNDRPGSKRMSSGFRLDSWDWFLYPCYLSVSSSFIPSFLSSISRFIFLFSLASSVLFSFVFMFTRLLLFRSPPVSLSP